MKTLLLIVVCALLAGCGSEGYVEEPVRTKYTAGMGLSNNFDKQVEVMKSCSILDPTLASGSGRFYANLGNAYLPPIIEFEATASQLECYKEKGSFDYISFEYITSSTP